MNLTIVNLIQKKENRVARSFNLSFRYNDDVLSLNNHKELEINKSTDVVKSASFQPHILTYTYRSMVKENK